MAITEGNKKILTVLGEEIEEAVSLKHSHDNSNILNKFTEEEGKLCYDNKPINNTETTEQHTHNNKEQIDKIGEDSNGNLTYNGNVVISTLIIPTTEPITKTAGTIWLTT